MLLHSMAVLFYNLFLKYHREKNIIEMVMKYEKDTFL